MIDPLADWRSNPFFVLEVNPQASRTEIERAGQKLAGLLALGAADAGRYDTPFGPATRDADAVRRALATLRDPNERVICELWANVALAAGDKPGARTAERWQGAPRAIGWNAKWAE